MSAAISAKSASEEDICDTCHSTSGVIRRWVTTGAISWVTLCFAGQLITPDPVRQVVGALLLVLLFWWGDRFYSGLCPGQDNRHLWWALAIGAVLVVLTFLPLQLILLLVWLVSLPLEQVLLEGH